MYVVTFYSFKGGVGRSLALMNCAAELVKQGRNVLVVDLDLEAPGLENFNLPVRSGKKIGVVDYINEYLVEDSVPSIRPYVRKISLESGLTGNFWMMTAGENSANYNQKLHAINWQELYEKRSGYLLFENLKGQWKKEFNPDYVLIDSRTGYTDVGEICTRQLPDGIVFLFFPNQQNLSGLSRIVKRIKDDARNRNKAIEYFFVPSNVPYSDDENRVLKRLLEKFKKNLDFSKVAATIHHYDSMDLINQKIFTLKRPNTRLAIEYRELTGVIQKANLGDEIGALTYVEEQMSEKIEELKAELESSLRTNEDDLNLVNFLEDLDCRLDCHIGSYENPIYSYRTFEMINDFLDTGELSDDEKWKLKHIFKHNKENQKILVRLIEWIELFGDTYSEIIENLENTIKKEHPEFHQSIEETRQRLKNRQGGSLPITLEQFLD